MTVEPIASTGNGEFFAIDRRAWVHVCALGMNPAVAYLVLARGTGRDQRTTAWSVKAIEDYTGISRPRAAKAVADLEQAELIRVVQRGSRPRYSIVPAHEVPACEGNPPALTADERAVADRLNCKTWVWVPNKHEAGWPPYRSPRGIADDLVTKKWAARRDGSYAYALIHDAEAAAVPDWIWLPNALVDGARGETAPVELIRQTQNVPTLRLFVGLYHAQTLASDGGIHWRRIRREFISVKVGQRAQFTVFGFQEKSKYETVFPGRGLADLFMTGKEEPIEGTDRKHDTGWKAFWASWEQIKSFGLVEIVGHVIEADTDQAEMIYPYAVGNGEEAERQLADVAHRAGEAMLTEGQRRLAEDRALRLAPLPKHFADPQMVGIARLRYRPRTGATAAWFARMAEWAEAARRLEAIAQQAENAADFPSMQHQGLSR